MAGPTTAASAAGLLMGGTIALTATRIAPAAPAKNASEASLATGRRGRAKDRTRVCQRSARKNMTDAANSHFAIAATAVATNIHPG